MPRLIELVESPFGEHAVCTSLSGREEISKPYEFFLSILSPELNLGPMQVVGQEICVRIDRGDQPPRFVHGFVNHLLQVTWWPARRFNRGLTGPIACVSCHGYGS